MLTPRSEPRFLGHGTQVSVLLKSIIRVKRPNFKFKFATQILFLKLSQLFYLLFTSLFAFSPFQRIPPSTTLSKTQPENPKEDYQAFVKSSPRHSG
ncbi:hypothetical protein L596_028230 [Steinernema carpocapsae]|uniref:Uncharacterized protein n=1 Tax=Steinernema carpocapsae TaxID=34508 RepID=A0A4U5LXW2_STECR|nr:hypothetical protein L596_028230 [Steinernema carpocapsae]